MLDFIRIAREDASRLIQQARNSIRNRGMYSNFREEEIIAGYLTGLGLKNLFVVDIAAQDGRTMSNTYRLFMEGAAGILVECDGEQFSKLSRLYRGFGKVSLLKAKATPQNVNGLLKACSAPRKFSLLSLDIDSYDNHILREILSEFRPSLICAEINEAIPPPLRFSVNYDEEFSWGKGHFFGQSICALHALGKKNRYDLVELHYNNAFLIPREINKYNALTAEEAYAKGYLGMPDRKEKFPWNADFEQIHSMGAAEAKKFIAQKFAAYKGKYSLQ